MQVETVKNVSGQLVTIPARDRYVPWCSFCAKRHDGDCADVDAPRDNSPSVNVNLRGVADDGPLGTGYDASGDYPGIVEVTDGTNVKCRAKVRETCIGVTDTVVTRADGSTYVIPRRKDRRDAKRATARKVAEVRETEAARWALAQRAKLSPDEIKSLNGLT